MPLVCYVSEQEINAPLDAERLLRLLGVSGKLSGSYYMVYMLELVKQKPDHILLDRISGHPLTQPPTNTQFIDMLVA